jgi:hypothetical protein
MSSPRAGGMLNQIFTHALAQVLRVTDSTPPQVTGKPGAI